MERTVHPPASFTISSRPTKQRAIRSRRHNGFTLSALFAFANLASSVLAYEPRLAPVTATANISHVAPTLVVDCGTPLITNLAWISNQGAQELKRRDKHDQGDNGRHGNVDHSEKNDDGDAEGKDEKQGGKDDLSGDSSGGIKAKAKDESFSSTFTPASFADKSKTIASEDLATLSSMPLSLRTSSIATAVASNAPLPSPFDGSSPSDFKANNQDNSCPTFMGDLFASSEFKNCYPLSMLLQTSTSFFDAEKQLFSIVRVLDATCSADAAQCNDYFNKAAQNLTSDANCKAEYDNKQYLVMQAYKGLKAYEMLYTASCLQDPDLDMYCFANAVTNSSTVSDAYLYYMPYGNALPGASRPSCNWCTKQTMAVYHVASSDRKQPVATIYEAAAGQVNAICGVNFVNATLPSAQSRAAVVSQPLGILTIASLVLAGILIT